jgi:hypothetical protein
LLRQPGSAEGLPSDAVLDVYEHRTIAHFLWQNGLTVMQTRFIEKSKLRFSIPQDIMVWLAKGGGKIHAASFIEEQEGGSIVLYGLTGVTKYERQEYRSWGLDDVQINAPEDPTFWKLNIEKSKLPHDSSLSSRVMIIEEIAPGCFRDSFEDVGSDGAFNGFAEPDRRFDGVERPVSELRSGCTQMCEKIDTTTDRVIQKKDGQVIRQITNRTTKDGLLFTIVEEGIRSDGQRYEAMYVYDAVVPITPQGTRGQKPRFP